MSGPANNDLTQAVKNWDKMGLGGKIMNDDGRGSTGLLIALVAIIALGAFVTLARHGLVDLVRLSAERDALQEEKATINRRNQELLAEIERLKTDPQAVEAVAREELGLAKPGELIYRFDSRAVGAGEERPDG